MSDVLAPVDVEPLATLVRESALSGVERHAMLLLVDLLPRSLSTSGHLRRLRDAMLKMTLADRGRLHEMPNGRLVVTWKGDAPFLLRATTGAIDSLLQENPFEAPGTNKLIEFFDLPADGPALLRSATEDLRVEAVSTPPMAPVFDLPVAPKPLDAALLARLEQALAVADLSRFARRRPVCHLLSQGLQPAWEERFLSVPDLMSEIAPHSDARAEPWLFRRLTRILDKRMLSLLSSVRELREAGPFGITLNVASVLNAEFLRFDSVLPPRLRGRVVLSFLPADVAADASAFAFARNFARSRSYRVAIRAVTSSLLPALDLAQLDLDFVQLVPSPELYHLSALPAAGRARWIMGRPCPPDALMWGRRAGIGLFATSPTQ